MSDPQNDHAFKALQETADALEISVSSGLLLDLYVIQREHQFDRDRSNAIRRMQQRILSEVDDSKVTEGSA